MDKREYFDILERLHLRLWLLERYLRRGDVSAEKLYREYIDILRKLLEKGEEYYCDNCREKE